MVSLAEAVGVPGRLARMVEGRVAEWYARHGRPGPVYVGFSGGKDSTAVLAAAVHALGPEAVAAWFWHIPGQTINDNVVAGMRVARALGLRWATYRVGEPREVHDIRPEPGTVHHVIIGKTPYWELLALRGPPAPPPRPRWCCKLYKEDPLAWTRPQKPGKRYIINGVKRSDSRARAKRWADSCERTFRPRKGPAREDIALAPLCDLTDHDVWLILQHYELHDTIQQQYEKWGRSPNCALCPLASKKQLQTAARNLPTPYIRRYLNALNKWNTSLASRMKKILQSELEQRGDNQ